MLVDSHCHLDFPDFAAERAAVIARAGAAGVATMLTIATRLDERFSLLGSGGRAFGGRHHTLEEALDWLGRCRARGARLAGGAAR